MGTIPEQVVLGKRYGFDSGLQKASDWEESEIFKAFVVKYNCE